MLCVSIHLRHAKSYISISFRLKTFRISISAMSKMSEDPFSDEEDSYKNVLYTKGNSDQGEGTIIDESEIEDSTENNQSNDSMRDISNRQSTIIPVRRKTARVLDSEDDEEYEDNSIENSSENESTHASNFDDGLSDNNSDEDYVRSREEPQSSLKKKSYVEATSDEEDEEREQAIRSSSSSQSSKRRKQKINVIASDSEDEDHISKMDSFSKTNCNESPQINLEVSPPENKTESENLSISKRMGNARISNHFQFNAEGILNSTAIHSSNKNTAWRLSHNFREVKEISSENSLEVISDHDSDIIEVSSDGQMESPRKNTFKVPTPRIAARQQTLHAFIVKKENTTPQHKQTGDDTRKPLGQLQATIPLTESPPQIRVSLEEYEAQLSRVESLEIDFVKLQNMIENINFDALPDKGKLIKDRLKVAENRYMQEKHKLDKMDVPVTEVDKGGTKGAFDHVAWEDLEAGANAVLPKTFGKKAMSTYNTQKAVTLDRLQQLHLALQTCPKEEDIEDDPKGIKVSLMPHQKRALAWILFREKEKPSGGILADDMGLGKTLTMISLIVKCLELEEKNDSDEENEFIGKNKKFNGGSLIVCPASLINQWSGEIENRLKRGLLSYYLYHGAKRETKASNLSKYDVVITTYAIVNNESDRQGAVFKVKWRRVILDEAHTIRNHKAQTSVACCQLLAKSRWALTGTPMHNKELDMYALLKFLRCSPFDDLQVWKRWVGDKSAGGLERLHTVISSLMLRRTKTELMEKGALNCMPEKKWELVQIELDPNEMKVYHKVLIFSQTLFAQFLHQRAEKNQDYVDHKFTDLSNHAPNEEYMKMRQKLLRLNKVKDVSQHEILVLLLRLRQICCHPSLITAMLDESRGDIGEGDEECEQLNLLDQLEKLNIEDEDEHADAFNPNGSLGHVAEGISQETKVTLKEASKGQLHPSDPVFAQERGSSKIRKVLKVLEERVLNKGDKAIIVSQWSSYLRLVQIHLKNYEIEFDQLDGNVPVNKRMEMVNRLNNPNDKLKVLLLSLTAGGVGLNLVGANHLFLLDLHWNPQLENQAQDRIYRVGQTKPVFVYKFMATDTIEERIKALQDKKLAMAEGLLTGTKQATQSKLSLEDLKMIFGM